MFTSTTLYYNIFSIYDYNFAHVSTHAQGYVNTIFDKTKPHNFSKHLTASKKKKGFLTAYIRNSQWPSLRKGPLSRPSEFALDWTAQIILQRKLHQTSPGPQPRAKTSTTTTKLRHNFTYTNTNHKLYSFPNLSQHSNIKRKSYLSPKQERLKQQLRRRPHP